MQVSSLTKLASCVALAFSFGMCAQAAPQEYVTGSVQGPGGEAVDGATVYICTGLVKTEVEQPKDASGKTKIILYYTSAKPGDGRCEGTGRTNREGKFKVRYPADREGGALFVWKKLYEPIIVRDVKAPMELGVVKLPGTNTIERMDKRNIEAKMKADKLAAENRAKARETRIRVWRDHEEMYPGGIRKLRDRYVITQADIDNAKAACASGKCQDEYKAITKNNPGTWITYNDLALEALSPRRVKGRVLTPEGSPVSADEPSARTSILVGQKLTLDKAGANRWFVSGAVSMGSLYEEGNMDFTAPPDKKWDILVWRPGYEPFIVRDITPPQVLGDIRFPGKNADLKEIIRR